MQALKDDLKRFAADIGLDLIGVTTADPFDRYLQELDLRSGHYQPRYSQRLSTWQRLAQPRQVLPEARAVVVIGYYYYNAEPVAPTEPVGRLGRIVSYGHLGILLRAQRIRQFLKDQGCQAVLGIHRKEAAVRAGLGMIGKNGLVLNKKFGSWVAYQSIVTDAALEPDAPFTQDLCGNCDDCRRACPTQALYEPYRLDPRRCVTGLLTAGQVSQEYWPAMGCNILGCDTCIEACPYNQRVTPRPEVDSLFPADIGCRPPLNMLLTMTEQQFQREVMAPAMAKMSSGKWLGRLLRYPRLQALVRILAKLLFKGKEAIPETFMHASGNLRIYQRNALIAAGNLGDASLLPVIEQYRTDAELGTYAAWAAERLTKQ